MKAHGFRVCFTPLLEVLFTFPSRYLSTIGLSVVFSLTGWAPQIPAEFLVLRGTQVPSRPGARVSRTGLSPSMVPVSTGLPLHPRHRLADGPTTPGAAAWTAPVWAAARSLATTCAIILIFSSSGYLDVSVPRVRPPVSPVWRDRSRRVSPFGHPRVTGHLPLTAAFRSLSRPSSPPRATGIPHAPFPSFLSPYKRHHARALGAARPPPFSLTLYSLDRSSSLDFSRFDSLYSSRSQHVNDLVFSFSP